MLLSSCAEKKALAAFNKTVFRKPHLGRNDVYLVTMQHSKHPTNVVLLHLH